MKFINMPLLQALLFGVVGVGLVSSEPTDSPTENPTISPTTNSFGLCDVNHECELGTKFCNYDDGTSGYCESCSGFTAPEDCDGNGVPSAGAQDCKDQCNFEDETTSTSTTTTTSTTTSNSTSTPTSTTSTDETTEISTTSSTTNSSTNAPTPSPTMTSQPTMTSAPTETEEDSNTSSNCIDDLDKLDEESTGQLKSCVDNVLYCTDEGDAFLVEIFGAQPGWFADLCCTTCSEIEEDSETTLSPTMTIVPTEAPTTLTPTEAPTTLGSTEAPTTLGSTEAPNTPTPTSSPTTANPTINPTKAPSTSLAPTANPTQNPTINVAPDLRTLAEEIVSLTQTVPADTPPQVVINLLVFTFCEVIYAKYEGLSIVVEFCSGTGEVVSETVINERALQQTARARRYRRLAGETSLELEIDMEYSIVETDETATEAPIVPIAMVTELVEEDPEVFEEIYEEAILEAIDDGVVPPGMTVGDVTSTLESEGGSSTSFPEAEKKSDGGMGAGAIAGVAIGAVAVVGLLGLGAFEYKKRNRDSGSTWESEGEDELEQYQAARNSRNVKRNRAGEYDLEVAKPEDIDFITSVDSNDDFRTRSSSRGAGSSIRGDLQKMEKQISTGDDLMGRALGGGANNTMGFANSQSSSFGASSAGYDVETVYAPPGKLGVVVDSSNNGPCVHCVRDNSPLLNIIRVGDKILSIDDIDCRSMSAGAVTKLMAKKSTQKERKLVFAHPNE